MTPVTSVFQDRYHRLSRRLVPFVPLALAAMLVPAPAAQAAPRPAFYERPASLPTGGPGTLIRAERFAFRGVTRPQAGTEGWRLLYTSTGATGEQTVVSGALLLPPGGPVPDQKIVSVAVGNHGMGDSCAPSRLLAGGVEPDLATMRSLLRRGHAVAVTDYQGLGTAGQHTFAVNRALGRNVLDVIRAARQVADAALPADGVVGITGYSEGGGAAASAAELAGTYAPELRLAGTVAGGTLSNPETAIRPLDGNVFAGLMLAGMIGYGEAYPDLNVASYLNDNGRWLYRTDTDACQQFVARFLFNRLSWYTRRSPISQADWKARMRENTVGSMTPNAPVYLYHGRFDQAVFYQQTTGTRNAWCRRGANVRFRLNPYGEHFTTQFLEEPGALRWLDARLSGAPATPNC